MNARKKIVGGAMAVLAAGGISTGMAIAHAGTPAHQSTASVTSSQADTPEPGDTPDQPGQGAPDLPEPGDTPDSAH